MTCPKSGKDIIEIHSFVSYTDYKVLCFFSSTLSEIIPIAQKEKKKTVIRSLDYS